MRSQLLLLIALLLCACTEQTIFDPDQSKGSGSIQRIAKVTASEAHLTS